MAKPRAHLKSLLIATALTSLAPLPLSANEIFAQAPHDAEAPAVLQADRMDYDPNTARVTAEGRVEIQQGDRILLADRLIYDQKSNAVYATGDVALMEPTGQVYFAKNVALKDDLKEGAIQQFRARFADNSVLAAAEAKRTSGSVTELKRAVYSACSLCAKDPTKAPLWQIKADKVRVDETEQKVTYSDAMIEVFGVPVIYTPYLSHATPGADNKSGFLPPSYGTINTLGATVQIPYYVAIEPYMDATIAPMFTSDEGTVMTGEFRHLTENGQYELSGSITNPQKRDDAGNRIAGHETRGHIQGSGRFDLDNNWAWGFEGKRATDDTYLRRYKFGYEDSLTSTAYINQVRGRNFIGARGLTFQGLNADDDPATTPFILPLTQAHFETKPGYLGSRLMLDANTMVLYRSEGTQSRRVSMDGGYVLPIITRSGHLLTFGTHLRGDVYSVEDVATGNDPSADGAYGRLIPEATAEWSYPLIRRLRSGSNVTVEPIVAVAVSPNGMNPDDIPNEDSQNFELNDLNLFSANKFTGQDRVETGPRANYGVRTSYNTGRQNYSVMLGQSYRLKADNALLSDSGLENDLSNYVGRLEATDSKYYDAYYSFRLNNDDYEFARSEIGMLLNFDPFSIGTDYIFLNSDTTAARLGDREEILSYANYALNEQWRISGSARRGLGQDDANAGLISTGLGLYFQNECLGISTIFNREYTRDRDIEPSTSVVMQISLRNLN